MSTPIALTRPSKQLVSASVAIPPRTRPAIEPASSASSAVQSRATRTSASTCARPPIPLCMPSRYAGTSVAGGVVTDSGIQGPASSQRTWSSTHRQAAPATAAYVSGVRAGIWRYSARGTTQLAVTGSTLTARADVPAPVAARV